MDVMSPRRVLVVHARYRSAQPSGENAVVDDETRLLEEYGCSVERVELRSDDIAEWPAWRKATLPVRITWSRAGQSLLQRAIERTRPDVIHIHNTFPLFSPAVFFTARRSGAGVVHTLHNFRPLCPAGTLLRDGKPCEDCVGRLPVPSVVHACYRGSRPATLPVALMDAVHGRLKTWHRCIDRIIVLSSYVKDKYIAAGWPEERIRVKYNTIYERDLPARESGTHFLSLSRLEPAKGVDVLLEAWERAFPEDGSSLLVAGGGEDYASFVHRYGELAGVRFLGQIEQKEAYRTLAQARALIVPSRWYEGFPRVVAEAYALGVPVVASSIGSLAELVDNRETGLLVKPNDPDDLARALREVADSPELALQLGAGARAAYERLYSPEMTMERLLAIYDEAIAESHARRRANGDLHR
jgi:glycosyltransferase involved in cell wall biosynthesis